MFRASKYPTNMSENAYSRWSTSFMDSLSIFITEQSVIAVAEHRRRGCPSGVDVLDPNRNPLLPPQLQQRINHVQSLDAERTDRMGWNIGAVSPSLSQSRKA